MEFVSIFTYGRGDLWAVCYPENKKNGKAIDVFWKTFEDWNDTEYLEDFFFEHEADLADPFWDGISIDEAVDKILDERSHFGNELLSIEQKRPGYEKCSLNNIFNPLHENIYALTWKGENFRKAKPAFDKPMLRIYAIQLEDGVYIITGGAIKVTKKMIGAHFDKEFANLRRVQEYLNREGICNITGLLQ